MISGDCCCPRCRIRHEVCVSYIYDSQQLYTTNNSLEEFRGLQAEAKCENLTDEDLDKMEEELKILSMKLKSYGDLHEQEFKFCASSSVKHRKGLNLLNVWGENWYDSYCTWITGICNLLYYRRLDNKISESNPHCFRGGYTINFYDLASRSRRFIINEEYPFYSNVRKIDTK
jgi:hypothetical protein